jgi:hypothetical protein
MAANLFLTGIPMFSGGRTYESTARVAEHLEISTCKARRIAASLGIAKYGTPIAWSQQDVERAIDKLGSMLPKHLMDRVKPEAKAEIVAEVVAEVTNELEAQGFDLGPVPDVDDPTATPPSRGRARGPGRPSVYSRTFNVVLKSRETVGDLEDMRAWVLRETGFEPSLEDIIRKLAMDGLRAWGIKNRPDRFGPPRPEDVAARRAALESM